jgi:6-phosphogluconolactonase
MEFCQLVSLLETNFLYVVNSASANISGFTFGAGGTLTPIPGSSQSLSAANAQPAQIGFKPGRRFLFDKELVVKEKATNRITTFPLTSGGVAQAGSSVTSANTTPFGFDFSLFELTVGFMIVAEAAADVPNGSTVSSYSITPRKTISLISGPVPAGQSEACWVVVSRDSRFAFVTNTGSNTISSFSISTGGILQVIGAVAATTGDAPADIAFSHNESYLYNINSVSHTISEFRRGNNNTLQSIGQVTGLPANAAGLVAF